MLAVVLTRFGAPDALELARVPRPQVLPGEVLVRVHAAGVNPVDWKTREGAPTPAAQSLGTAPHILGWDISGVVEAIGGGVHRFAVGDEVFGMPWFPRPAGGYAEYLTAPARQLALKPRSWSHEEAAAVPLAGLTALHALTEIAEIVPGQRVLIHAAGGGVGHLAVQIAASLGATVIGTARSAKHPWLKSLGADELVDYTVERFEEVAGQVDAVLDLVGGADPSTAMRSVEIIRPGGIYVPVAPGTPASLGATATDRGVRVAPSLLVDPDGHGLELLASMADAHQLSVNVEEVFPLADAADAHRRGETNAVAGKLVLRVRG